MEIPRSMKPVARFIKRAEELDRDRSKPESRLMAFYCRQYAAEKAMALRENDSSDEVMRFLLELVEQLEAEKKEIPEFSPEEVQLLLKRYILQIFDMADEEDRSGNATKTTAQRFNAAGTFIEVLRQIGELDEGLAAKMKYCKFKALDIIKAIKEGRKPTPGNPLAEEEEEDIETGIEEKGEEAYPDPAVSINSVMPQSPRMPEIPTAPGYPGGDASNPTLGRQGSMGFAEAAIVAQDPEPTLPVGEAPPSYENVTPQLPLQAMFGGQTPVESSKKLAPPAISSNFRMDMGRQHDSLEYVLFAQAALRRQRGDRAVQHLQGAKSLLTGGNAAAARQAAERPVNSRTYKNATAGAAQGLAALEKATTAIGTKNVEQAKSHIETALGLIAG